METINVRPGPGRKVRLENTNVPIPEGVTTSVPKTQHYLRRLRDGDLVVVEQEQPKKASRRRAVAVERED